MSIQTLYRCDICGTSYSRETDVLTIDIDANRGIRQVVSAEDGQKHVCLRCVKVISVEREVKT